ncbi:unnamed protein product [Meloidogyne enterolobii]|uniref:Uncharacterized protein n=1 Tax=Meloidogyne enterolobii TaxID=390850 RepID=A0ACB1AWV1_MELEN
MRWTFMELIPFAALGIFGGLLGSLFIWSNIKWCAYRKNTQWLGQNPIYEVLVVSAVTGALSFFNPYTRKSASSLIKQLFDRCGPEDYGQNLCDYNRNFTFGQVVDKVDDNYHTGDLGSGLQTAIFQLVMALFAKLLFTIFTFGVKVPSGLFVPSLAMGAIAGRLLGIKVEGLTYALQQQYPKSDLWTCRIGRDCVMPGLYAMVGAAAVLGGVTRFFFGKFFWVVFSRVGQNDTGIGQPETEIDRYSRTRYRDRYHHFEPRPIPRNDTDRDPQKFLFYVKKYV